MKIVIIGGVAGGASAAAKARRVNESAEIVMFEKGPYVSFANCGLPYYFGGQIQKREDLLLQTPESFWNRFKVKVYVRHEVLAIERNRRTVSILNLVTGEKISHPYDRLVLATGAGALVPNLPGITADNIFTVKTVPDGDAVKSFISTVQPRRAVVVGGGFIGLESADVLKKQGIDVTLVELLPQVLPPFDADMARFVSDHLSSEGVNVLLGDGLKAFHGSPRATEIELASGKRLAADLFILSLGVRPEIQLAKTSGIALGPSGAITVNDRQQTSDPHIYAAGDAVEVVHLVTGQKTRVPLAGPANKQGRVAGANAAGGNMIFPGALGTAIVEVMGFSAAKTGLSEKEAVSAGLSFYTSYTHSLHHAGYFPGGEMLHMKLVVEKNTGRILGGQIVGEQGVDKRIDVLATAIGFGKTVLDLENLDLAYAPSFSSAKDPVILAGSAAANVVRGEVDTISCDQLESRLSQGADLQIVDVRTPAEQATQSLPQAKSIPLDELRDRWPELDLQKETVVYCRVGLRGYLASRILRFNGFKNVKNLSGGLLSCPPAPSFGNTKSAARVQDTITVPELKTRMEKGPIVLIDVRDAGEFAFEKIAGSIHIPLERFPQDINPVPKECVVVCQLGFRSRDALAAARATGWTDVQSLEGGINAWKKAGFPVVRSGGPIPIMRQVQIVAGGLALVGGLFGSLRWVAVVVGAGLIFAGISGLCGMAHLLALMPWNKRRSPSRPSCKDNTGPCG